MTAINIIYVVKCILHKAAIHPLQSVPFSSNEQGKICSNVSMNY